MERKEITKELTKEQAIKLHRIMWLWIAKEIARNKKPMVIGRLKETYISRHTEFESVICDCFACEYGYKKSTEEYVYGGCCENSYHCKCEFCPLEWRSSGDVKGHYMCEENKSDSKDRYGLYASCKRVYRTYSYFEISKKSLSLWKKQAKLAYKIATLPEKE